MKRIRVYVDTSVLGGCFDPEFAEWSNALMDDFRSGEFALVLSDITAGEVAAAPESVQRLLSELLDLADSIPVTEEALELLRAYESHRTGL